MSANDAVRAVEVQLDVLPEAGAVVIAGSLGVAYCLGRREEVRLTGSRIRLE